MSNIIKKTFSITQKAEKELEVLTKLEHHTRSTIVSLAISDYYKKQKRNAREEKRA